MKVFISWSGEKSRAVAEALSEWLPVVINDIQPFVSAVDIHAGSRWQSDIASELDASNFGIVCVTRENQEKSWLNFEAGALAKSVDSSRVIPLAIDLKPSDIELPLGQFQAQPATEEGIEKILTSLNSSSEGPLKQELLSKAFSKWWPELESNLAEISDVPTSAEPPTRSERELLEETLDTVRSLARSLPNTAGPSAAEFMKHVGEGWVFVQLAAAHFSPDEEFGFEELASRSGETVGALKAYHRNLGRTAVSLGASISDLIPARWDGTRQLYRIPPDLHAAASK